MEIKFYPLIDFEKYYEISKCGIVRSKDREVDSSYNARRVIKSKVINPDLSNKGYLRIPISIKGIVRKKFGLHRLLALNFIPNPENLPIINHIDGNPLNNSLSNLEWCTQSYNMKNKFERGYIHHRRTLSDEVVIDIYKNTILRDRDKKIKGNASEMRKKHSISKIIMYGIVHNKTYLNITSKINNKNN